MADGPTLSGMGGATVGSTKTSLAGTADTLVGEARSAASAGLVGTADTLAGEAPGPGAAGLAETLVGPDPAREGGSPATREGTGVGGTSSRSVTVLPRVALEDGVLRVVNEPRARYETERVLGEGGMGIVALAQDRDIDRPVAVKRIRQEVGERGLARFAEEVRTIGHLEHPNIVPIHDVGVDENGDYFFVMKYVEGQTLEEIIEALGAGEAEAHQRFTWETRVQIFISLLRALSYAHDHGIVHRDVKPANIMVGRYGEVVLMDWGIARPVDRDAALALAVDEDADSPDAALLQTESGTSTAPAFRRRVVQTSGGGLVGTPLYMSPEQARGASDLDRRSDLYSACVVFHELLSLRHYLADDRLATGDRTVPAILIGVMQEEIAAAHHSGRWAHPHQSLPPAEYLHFLNRGMKKEPDARWQSAEEMIDELEAALSGRIAVQCPVTFTKRMLRESARFVDRHPLLAPTSLFVSAGAILAVVTAAVIVLVS